ncbi:AAA family ATPase [Candidatus Micrarchaeota archaeon]|nr:AAA family ATPase [Candidatus Micrarchaeota archaeon]
MGLFDDLSKDSVFKNELALTPDFIPENLAGRETELKEIAFALQPVLKGSKARAVFLHGVPGTGKTTSAEKVMQELKDYSQSVACFKVNCWNNYTHAAVLSELAQQAGIGMPRRGLASDEVFARVEEELSKKKTVVFLDEVDRLAFKGEENALYELSRSNAFKALILATNNSEFLTKLDDRIRSSLNALSIEYKKYSPKELKEILRERAKIAFKTNACSEEAIALCTAFAAKNNGDARLAISLLLDSGRNADKRGSQKVDEVDARQAIDNTSNPSKDKKLVNLNSVEKQILDFLKDKEASAGEVYASISLGERAGRNYLRLLEAKGLITRTETTKGKGRTTIVKLK